MHRHLARLVLSIGFALLATVAIVELVAGQDAQPKVYVLPTGGVVDQVMAGYLHDGIAKAAREGAAAALIEIDTPGGDLQATDSIVETLLQAPLPVIVWVGPGGARAASAGTYITLSAHVAVMDPAARIGAATPIDSSGGDIGGTLGEKILQDTEAQLRVIAQERHRNYDWALTTVTESKAYTAQEAVAAGGVDGLASSVDDAVAFANGRIVDVNGTPVTLDLTNAQVSTLAMNPFQSLLHLVSDPNIAFILFTIGFYGLLFELSSPNLLTGTLGGIAIVLAFIGFGSLPLNVAGLLLIGLGIVLFIVDAHITNHGVPTIGGVICFVLGASALYTEPGTPAAPDVSVALPVLVVMTTLTALFAAFIVIAAMRTRRMTTAPGLIGASLAADLMGEVRKPLTPIGSVYAGGQEWSARATDEQPLSRGTPVKIVRKEGLTLVVEPAEAAQ